MRVRMVCLEDGITSCGFRKMAAHVTRLLPDTESRYISTARYHSVRTAIRGMGGKTEVTDDQVDEIAQDLATADLVGLSSMTGYAELTHRVISRVRELNPSSYIIWGGIHPIIQPEDAILAPVDAICTGEGEFAFEQFLDAFRDGRDHTGTGNFWFKRDVHSRDDADVIKNPFLPLMTAEDMETLEFPQYGSDGERIYLPGKGFMPMGFEDYLINDGLGYPTVWSIGCPFHCTYCGNTKFISNDSKYKRIRHPSARYMVDQIKDARARFPHISQVSFHDDSFMAIPYRQLEEFAELWHDELDLPFCVYGVIPNYVRQDKFELLTWAGMNRVRMGIQTGSEDMLEFYRRPTPPEKIRAAGNVIASFAPKYHIPAAYDIIMDNPVETRDDVKATLQLLYDLDRPYTLYIYSLKVIPNTEMATAMEERGIDLDLIDETFFAIPPRVANLILYVIAVWRPPPWLWKRMLARVRASGEKQRLYPRLGLVLRTIYLTRMALNHTRKMDFSILPGKVGYYAWKVGLVKLWRRRLTHRLPRPERPPEVEVGVAGEGAAAISVELRTIRSGRSA